jgi:hypothetical protein
MSKVTLPLLLVLLTASCVTSRMVANNMPPVIADMERGFYAEACPRNAEAAAPALLMMLDGFLVSSPENDTLLVKAASMNCGYAFTFLETTDRAWAAAVYSKGLGYAIRAVALQDPALAKAILARDDPTIERRLAKADADLSEAVFWSGLCMGGRVGATLKTEDLPDIGTAQLLLARALTWDEDYFFASGHLFYGILFAGRTASLGGEPERGLQHFNRHLELTGNRFLLGKVLKARNYAVSVQDPALFSSLLEEVLASDPAGDGDRYRLVNAVARQRARQLLEERPSLFPGLATLGAPEAAPEDEGISPDEDLDL